MEKRRSGPFRARAALAPSPPLPHTATLLRMTKRCRLLPARQCHPCSLALLHRSRQPKAGRPDTSNGRCRQHSDNKRTVVHSGTRPARRASTSRPEGSKRFRREEPPKATLLRALRETRVVPRKTRPRMYRVALVPIDCAGLTRPCALCEAANLNNTHMVAIAAPT